MGEKKMTVGKWYVYLADMEDGLCKRCMSLTGKPFIAKDELSSIPFHPNCGCRLESYQGPMIDSFREAYPSISSATLDDLLSKEYYGSSKIARPNQVNDDYHYYTVDGLTYKVNLATLHGLGILPNGKYIVGKVNEAENARLLELILAGKEKADHRVIGINVPLQVGTFMGPPRPAPVLIEGERKTITYFGQTYHGQVRNGELYLDETCQREFLTQVGLPDFSWTWSKYQHLSVSEIMLAARGYKSGYKPYDPSKPLPEIELDMSRILKDAGLAGQKGITTNLPILDTVSEDRTVREITYASQTDTGATVVTEYRFVTKSKADWLRENRGLYDFTLEATNIVGALADVSDPTVPISGALVTIPLSLVGQGATVANFVVTEFPPPAIARLDKALSDIRYEYEQVTLLCYVQGYDASFDKHGNLSLNYLYKYTIV